MRPASHTNTLDLLKYPLVISRRNNLQFAADVDNRHAGYFR